MDICLIFNPTARGHRAAFVRDHLTQLARRCVLKHTHAPGSARHQACEAVAEGYTTIVAGGGDGTVNEVLNGIGDHADGFAKTRLGILPLGTVNVLAKELDLPTSPEAAWSIIKQGHELHMDLPYAEFQGARGTERRYFAQLAGAGVDSRAVDLVRNEDKKRWGPAAYVLAAFQVLSERNPRIEVAHHGVLTSGEQVFIGNGRYYGGRFPIFPDASLSDGRLDVAVYPRLNWKTMAQSGWGLLTDRLHRAGDPIQFQSNQFALQCPVKMPLELDGENVGLLPARFGLTQGALRVLVDPARNANAH